MQITKNGTEKMIYPEYGKYLTQANVTDDTAKCIVKSVSIPAEESIDEWIEIDAEEVSRIRSAKAQQGTIIIPEEVQSMQTLTTMMINTLDLTDEQSLTIKDLYPEWSSFIGKSLSTGFKVLYNDKLYKVRQEIATVLEDQYPSVNTAALYEEICESHAGTKEDPIPYNNNMELFNGKYYIQKGITYKCNRDTQQAVYQDLSSLVGIYVELVTE